MAIRSRLKSKIKSLIFGPSSSPSTSTTSTNHTSQTVTKTTFVPPDVSTNAVPSTKETNGFDGAKTEIDTESSTEPVLKVVDTSIDVSTPDEELHPHESSQTDEQEVEVGADTEEATFVIEVVDLFPAICPHCGASSHNNWNRIESKFVCGSCDTAY